MVKFPSRVRGLGDRTAPGRAPEPPSPAVARPAPSGPSSWGRRRSSLLAGPAFNTMELRMPVGYPGAAVGGSDDALDGPGLFALNAVQQSALFWMLPQVTVCLSTGGRSSTGGETVLPRQNRLFPVWCLPCAVELPTRVKHPHSQGSVASSSARRRAPSAPRGSSFSWAWARPRTRLPRH